MPFFSKDAGIKENMAVVFFPIASQASSSATRTPTPHISDVLAGITKRTAPEGEQYSDASFLIWTPPRYLSPTEQIH
jgi:hypothetical protein